VFSGTFAGKRWTIVTRVDDRSKERIPATITACSVNVRGGIVVGTAGGDVFRIEGASGLRKLTRELLRFEGSVGSLIVGDDGRVAALGQRPTQNTEDRRAGNFGQKQRVLVWQLSRTGDDVVADLLMVAPVFAVGATPTSISALTGRGWVTHPCHGCVRSLDELMRTAEARNAEALSEEALTRLAGK